MKRKIFFDTLKKDGNLFILFFIMTGINLSVFLLYRIMKEAFFYGEGIILIFLILIFIIDYFRNLKKAKQLLKAKFSFRNGNTELPEGKYFEDGEYREIIEELTNKINELNLSFSREKQDTEDWYTLWVHQIKTPIAVLKLKIPEDEKETLRELFRIEEYADMALNYIRLESSQKDLVIREYSLDEMIRETLRKYAPGFIEKKLRLEYEGTDKKVITDKKWFLCILEQLVSNAVKYTNEGVVTVTVEGEKLIVSDTGTGIAKEDMPRIFEKGYTGINGRTGAKSSGLGLYLCSKASKLIGVKLYAQSVPGKGSRFILDFPKEEK